MVLYVAGLNCTYKSLSVLTLIIVCIGVYHLHACIRIDIQHKSWVWEDAHTRNVVFPFSRFWTSYFLVMYHPVEMFHPSKNSFMTERVTMAQWSFFGEKSILCVCNNTVKANVLWVILLCSGEALKRIKPSAHLHTCIYTPLWTCWLRTCKEKLLSQAKKRRTYKNTGEVEVQTRLYILCANR